MKRPDTFMDRIVSGEKFELEDRMGYLVIYEVIITFKDGTVSEYDVDHLRDPLIRRYCIQDLNSLALNGGLRGKANVEVFGNLAVEGAHHMTATFDFSDLTKTHHFGGQKKGGPKVNAGNQYEEDLAESFKQYADGGGKYPDHVQKILELISQKYPHEAFKSAEHVGGANKPRPLKQKGNNLIISAGGVDKLDIGSTLTDITLHYGPCTGKANKEIYLSVKFGDTLSFFNCGVRGGTGGLSLFPKQELQEGKVPALGQTFLDMLGIKTDKFIEVFQKYTGVKGAAPTVRDHIEKVVLQGNDKTALSNLVKSGVGHGYWMVHYDGSNLDCFEVSKNYMDSAAKIVGSGMEINYGGTTGAGKRVNIVFETEKYDFSFNIRSKSGGETYPTHANGDYWAK